MSRLHSLPPGPLLIDLQGEALTQDERRWLRAPVVGGVIFFARNYRDPAQFRALVQEIRRERPQALLTVDQEGGRVQRFREGLTRLPSAGAILAFAGQDLELASQISRDLGWLTATELAGLDVDFSYAPVCDLDFDRSSVIGDRAFGAEASVVTALAMAWWQGARRAGMAGVAKHFPGHGFVTADTHHARAVDQRSLAQLLAEDLQPFKALIAAGIEAVMPAHVVYPQVDADPASRSAVWLQQVLRQQLGFHGAVISDDLSMVGAADLGVGARVQQSLVAGCDILLLCNNHEALAEAIEVLQGLPSSQTLTADGVERRQRLMRRPPVEPPLQRTLASARDWASRILVG